MKGREAVNNALNCKLDSIQQTCPKCKTEMHFDRMDEAWKCWKCGCWIYLSYAMKVQKVATTCNKCGAPLIRHRDRKEKYCDTCLATRRRLYTRRYNAEKKKQNAVG